MQQYTKSQLRARFLEKMQFLARLDGGKGERPHEAVAAQSAGWQ
jgi:hypothetical protein